ncbi:MFS transporter [Bacillus benzoevorans]|uniref:YNFM family putative membrane transporter n=1 Tax=Bacillus benzoevorans TaxID=1456 RepID=A0A7X0HT66_9BACI|nr:YNFM family putative membrane transporter [Bacillus benzoevorans]
MKRLAVLSELEHNHQKYKFRDPSFKKMMAALTFASVITFTNLYFVQPIMPLLVRSFNISSASAGLSLSVAVISMILGLIFFSFLSDRIGRTKVMNVTLICSLIPLILLPLVPNFVLFLLLRFFQGFFIAGLPAAAIVYISEEVAPQSTGLGIMMYIAANGAGGMFGRIFVGYIADVASWKVSLFIWFCFALILFIIYYVNLPKSYYFQASQVSAGKDLVSIFSHLKNVLLIPAFIMGVLLQFSFTGIWTYLPFYLENDPFHLQVRDTSLTYLAYLTGIFGSIAAGRLSIHMKKPILVTMGTLLLIAGAWLTNIPSLPTVIIGLCLTCLGFFVSHSLMSAIVNERAAHHKAGASSLYLVHYYLGVATGGTLAGVIWQFFGWMGITVISLSLVPIMIWLNFYKR